MRRGPQPSLAGRLPNCQDLRIDPTLEQADRRLLAAVDGALAQAARRAGPWLACRPGCTECCHGPFPINSLDARRLQAGLAYLAGREPDRAAALIERARVQVERLAPEYPGDPATGVLDETIYEDDGPGDAFFSRWGDLPCPALDPAAGRCELYEHRPLTCRTFGPPAAIGRNALPHCRLCFAGAPAEAVEECRVELDREELEDRLLDRLAEQGDEGETVIAYALAAGSDMPGPPDR